MKLSEGYDRAVSLYGEKLANKMMRRGFLKNFCEAACRFAKEGVPLKTLQDDFKKGNDRLVYTE